MQIKIDGWTIVLAGQWNRRLFSPDWVSNYIFKENMEEIEFVMIGGDPVIRYKYNDVIFTPLEQQIVFNFNQISDEKLNFADDSWREIVRQLRHTSIGGVGFNFAFREEEPNISLVSLFDVRDLSKIGGRIKRSETQRTIEYDHQIINLRNSYDLEEGIIDFYFNFHKDVKDGEDAAKYADEAPRMISDKDVALEIMLKSYELSLEGE